MAIQQNQKRIRTTHIGSLPRPRVVLDLLKPKLNGQPYDEKVLDATVAQATADQMKKQVECGIDIVSDGQISKAGFFTDICERLVAFESWPNEKVTLFQKEVSAFPEYYEQYFKEAMLGGALAPLAPVVCIGPGKYVGEAAPQKSACSSLSALVSVVNIQNGKILNAANAAELIGRATTIESVGCRRVPARSPV